MKLIERVKAYRHAGFSVVAILGMIWRRIKLGHWSVWSELLFRETGTTIDTETSMTDFTLERGGRIIQIIVDPGGIAATSLIESGHVRIETKDNPDIVVPFHGNGVETATRYAKDFTIMDCDIPVKDGAIIKGKYYYNVTPVTPELTVFARIVS